jgi:CRP/FNR family transcriptional regulator, dissimilatory nitrate respiration regulator
MTLSVPELERDVAAMLAEFTLLRGLGAERLQRIASGCRRRRLDGGECLFHRGAPCLGFYGVAAGMMQLSVSNADGIEKVVEIIGPGETFGEAVMFLGRPYPVDAFALVRTELLMIGTGAVDLMLSEDPGFARAMLASMASRLHTMVTDIEMYTLRSATQRFVAFLARELGQRIEASEPQRVVLRSTKQVLASRLGLTPETLSRVMRDLADHGVVSVDGRRITVPDPSALASYAG